MRRAVEVVAGVDEPVGVEHDDGVDAQRFAAARDFLVAVDGVLAGAFAGAVEFAEVHGGDVGDLSYECYFSHGFCLRSDDGNCFVGPVG